MPDEESRWSDETRKAPQPDQTQKAPPPDQTQKAPQPDQTQKAPQSDQTQAAPQWSDEGQTAVHPSGEIETPRAWSEETPTPEWSDEGQTVAHWDEGQTVAHWADEGQTEVVRPPSDDARTALIALGKPWWRRPGVWAVIAGLVAVAVAIVLVMVLVVLPDSSKSKPAAQQPGEVFLETASSTGLDPFSPDYSTQQPARPEDTGPPPATPASATGGAIPSVDGSAPGNFGGSMNLGTCDAEGLITYLEQNPDKGKAWASVFKITPDQIPAFIRELTPVLLRFDTRVTNHGYFNGKATELQSVLQAGTAVLVNKYGEPTVRCACGNPLLPPVALTGAAPVYKPIAGGYTWENFKPQSMIVVKKSAAPVNIFRLWDPWLNAYFWRYQGIRIVDLAYDPNVDPPAEPPTPEATPPPPPPSTYVPPPTYTKPPTYTQTPTTTYTPEPTTTEYTPTPTTTPPTTYYPSSSRTTSYYPPSSSNPPYTSPPHTSDTPMPPRTVPITPAPPASSFVPPR